MSGTREEPIAGFPPIGQYEMVPGPGEPGYVEPEKIQVIDLNDPDGLLTLHNVIAEAVGEPTIDSIDAEDEAADDDDDLVEAHPDDDEEPIDPDDDDPYTTEAEDDADV